MSARLIEARIPRGYWHMTRQGWKEHDAKGRPTPWPANVSAWVRGEDGPFVTLMGVTGVGKSHVAVATLQYYLSNVGPWGRPKWWNELRSQQRDGGVFFTGRELAAEFPTGKFRGRPLLERALRAPLVVVDDVLWDRSLEDLERGAVAALIHNAEQTGAGLILTFNADLSILEGVDGRIVSRLNTGIFPKLEGEDRR